jgi:hypothetical protein
VVGELDVPAGEPLTLQDPACASDGVAVAAEQEPRAGSSATARRDPQLVQASGGAAHTF